MKKRSYRFSVFALMFSAAAVLLSGLFLLPPEEENVSASVATTVSSLPEGLEGLFTDYTRTELSASYRSEEALSALAERYRGNDAARSVLSRAEEALRGEVKFEPDREFSTEDGAPNEIEQYGDMAAYSTDVLKWKYRASDLLVTGIYGNAGTPFTVYVDADENARLPHLVLALEHAYYSSYRSEVYLSRGANSFSFTYSGSGAVYIVNPYTEEQQGGEVSLYIEGGGVYPVFEKGGDEEAFLGDLKAYEEERREGGQAPDLAELVTDFAFITTTSSSLYDTYIEYRTIDPVENLELWGELFTRLYEFNGIATGPDSPYKEHYDPRVRGVRLNFRYMKQYANSAAYAYTYHVGFYSEHYWFANYRNQTEQVPGHPTADYSVYAMGHEIGHMLDTRGRNLDETTNNMSATFTYLKVLGKTATAQFQPYARSLESLARDSSVDGRAFDEGRILYKSDPDYDHNYMVWWYLESCFPGYWAELNNMYRYGPTTSLGTNERLVYYSSLVTGVDLGGYFDRWGVFVDRFSNRFRLSAASQTYRDLMGQAEREGLVEQKFDRFYYADDAEYRYVRTHDRTDYTGETPEVSVKKTETGRVVSMSGKQDPAFLGYEVRVSLGGGPSAVAGFTRSTQFTDDFPYGSEPTYTAVAVNRFFAVSGESGPARAGEVQPSKGVCRIGERYFPALSEAVGASIAGDTIYLLTDCSADGIGVYRKIVLTPDEGAGDVRITVSGTGFMFQPNADMTLRGRADAHIVLDGGSVPRYYAPVYLSGGTFTAEYTDFVNHTANMGGGAVLMMSGELVFRNCSFARCVGPEAAVVSANKHTVRVESCSFEQNGTDIALGGSATLIFENNLSPLALSLSGDAEVCTEGFSPSPQDLGALRTDDGSQAVSDGGKIVFRKESHTLTFEAEGRRFDYEADTSFVFGEEHADFLSEDEYIEEYADGEGNVYRTGETFRPRERTVFYVTVKKKANVVLRMKSGNRAYLLAPGERIYLTRRDGNDLIAHWSVDGTMYPAGGSCSVAEDVFPVYVGYYRYEFRKGEERVSEGYQRYGASLSFPALGGGLFWVADGKSVTEEFVLTRDTVFYALSALPDPAVDLADARISLVGAQPVYNGKAQFPAVSVTVGGEEVPASLYELEYENNVNAGLFTVTARAVSPAAGSVSATFSILPRQISEEAIFGNLQDVVYTGRELRQTPAVTWRGEELGTDSVSFVWSDDLVNAGVVVVTATFCGNFTGSAEVSYKILKAAHPPLPSAHMKAEEGDKTLSDLPLPDGWAWETDMSVVGEGVLSAKAVYCGGDKENFEVTETEIEVELLPAADSPEDPERPDPEQPDPPAGPEQGKPEVSGGDGESAGCGGMAAFPAFAIFVLLPLFLRRKRE